MRKNLSKEEVAIKMAEDFKTIKFETENFGFDVSDYSTAVERSAELITGMLEKNPFFDRITVMPGHKANTIAQLNVMATSVFYSNANCVNSATGDATVIEPRTVNLKRLSEREILCLDDLDAKLPQLQRAGARNTDLSFAQLYVDLKLSEANRQNIKMAWQGDTAIVGTTNLNKVDGWLKRANAEKLEIAYYATTGTVTAANVLGLVADLVNNRSELQYERSADLRIFVDNATFDLISAAYITEHGINATGVFGDTGYQNQTGVRRMKDPASGIIIEAQGGLDGKGGLFMNTDENFILATDLRSDSEDVSLKYNEFDKSMYYDMVWTAGFTYGLKELVSYIELVPGSN